MASTPNANQKHPYTIALDSPSCLATHLVGAKASRLAEMGMQGYPIPKGFVVTTDAFAAFCQYNCIEYEANPDTWEPTLQQDIVDARFPSHLKTAIEGSIAAFSFESYAVRSSATMEDHIAHSMAGQFDTYLRTPKEHLLDRIKSCWASVFGDALISYARKHQISVVPGMGVIIQKQIDPTVAGVLFTMDPMTKSADHLILEWRMGLGDKLASGLETPERLYIRRGVPVHAHPDTVPPLLAAFLDELIAHALRAEKLFHCPLDIEWCVTHAGPVLLQARPITALTGKRRVIWTNVNMVENFPDVLTPFSWSIVDTFYVYYAKHMLRLFGWNEKRLVETRSIVENFTGIQAGRIYYNLSNWYTAANLLPIGKQLKRLLDSFIGQNVPLNRHVALSASEALEGWRRLMQSISFGVRMLAIFCTAGFYAKRYETQFYAHRDQWRNLPYDQLSLVELLGILDKILNDFVARYYYNPAMVDLLAAIFPGGLKLLTKKWLSNHFENTDLLSVQLMQGIALKSVEPAQMIQAISEEIAKDRQLQGLLNQEDYATLEDRLSGVLEKRVKDFMFRYGSRCYHDCTMATPTFEERHDLFWHLVEKYQLAPDASAVNTHARTDLADVALRQALKHLALIHRWVLRWILKNARKAIGLRERSRIIRSLLFGEIRQIVLAIGKKLSKKGHLSKDKEVFFLHWSEIKDIVFGKFQFPETVPTLIQMRKKAFEDNGAIDPPSLFIQDQSTYFNLRGGHQTQTGKPASLLYGVAVSGGTVTAKAKIILDPVFQNNLEPGEILVAQATDPGWTPLFQIAGGLILEKGGMLSHGAIVAREFGIPAVADVENATALIKDGQTLCINGDIGEITIVAQTNETR